MGKFKEEHKTYFYDMPIDLCCVIEIPSQKIIDANAAFEFILGWKPSEVINHTLKDFVESNEDKAVIDKNFEKLKLRIHSLYFEAALTTKNKLTRNIDWKCHWDENTNWVFAIGRDITSYKETEKKLAAQNLVDPQTNLPNREALISMLQADLQNQVRLNYPTSIILIRVDQSQEMIKRTALTLKALLRRKMDFVGRYDAAEFVVLLTHNNLEKTMKVAEYLRTNLEKQSAVVLLGIATIDENNKKILSADSFILQAKKSLEDAKGK